MSTGGTYGWSDRSGASMRGFTLIELLVVIAIIAVLAAILFPVFAAARGKARTTQCQSHMRQIAQAIMMYCGDNDGRGPYNACCPAGTRILWYDMLTDYSPNLTKRGKFYSCPDGPCYNMPWYLGGAPDGRMMWDIDGGPLPYGTKIKHPESVMIVGETETWSATLTGDPNLARTRFYWDSRGTHQGRQSMAFLDGHAERMSPSVMQDEAENGTDADGRGAWWWWWR